MGDRGGTATNQSSAHRNYNYTRWEIGGEPQQYDPTYSGDGDYTRWEIGGEPQPTLIERVQETDYTRWEIGGGGPQHVVLAASRFSDYR